MSIFSPEAIFRSLVSAMGVTPEQVINAINLVATELEALKTEIAALKVSKPAV